MQGFWKIGQLAKRTGLTVRALRHYDQIDLLKPSQRTQGDKYGQEKIQEVEREWPELIAKVKAEMDAGTPPTHSRVQKMAKRWEELIGMFSGGDQGIERKLSKAYQKAPDFGAQFGMTPELMEYVGKAMK